LAILPIDGNRPQPRLDQPRQNDLRALQDRRKKRRIDVMAEGTPTTPVLSAYERGRNEVLRDVAGMFNEGTNGDGWDIAILEDVDAYLGRNGFHTISCEDL
jgi:hypothetical protein